MSLTMMLPIFADQKWVLKKVPEDWNGMSPKDRYAYFMRHASPPGCICHACAKHYQIGELADEEIEDRLEDYFDDDSQGGVQP